MMLSNKQKVDLTGVASGKSKIDRYRQSLNFCTFIIMTDCADVH